MLFTLLAVFVAVFAVVLLFSVATGSDQRRREKRVLERVESVSMAFRRRPEDERLDILRDEMISSLPMVDRWLREFDLLPGLRKVLHQSNVSWTLADLLLRSLVLGAVAGLVVYWRTRDELFSAAMGVLAATGPTLYVLHKRSARFNAFEAKLPEALELMVRALRAGHGLVAGIEMVANEMGDPVGTEFKKSFDEQNYGLELREALLNLGERVPIHDVHIVITAIMIQRETGGNLAEVLEKVAYVIRERFRLKRQIRVHTAQGRLTGWILALMPVILGAVLYTVKPDFMARLWQHPTGLKMIYAAGIGTLIGGLIIRSIIRIRV